MANVFDQFDAATPAGNVFDQFDHPAAPEGAAADFTRNLKIGADVAAQDVRELVRKVPLIGPAIVGAVDKLDELTHGGTSSDALLKGDIESQTAAQSPEQQAALQKRWDTLGPDSAWRDWRSYTGMLAQSLPEEALTMVPAARLAKGVFAASLEKIVAQDAAAGVAGSAASKVAQKAAGDAAARVATIAGGATEGALGGAQSSRQVRDDIIALTPEQLKDSDALKALQAQGMSFEEARAQLAEDSSTKAMFLAGVATAAFGGMGDRVLAKAMTGQIAGGVVRRTAIGALGEGVLEELPQSALQQVSENAAMQSAVPSTPLTKDVANQALGGLAVGALQGGGQAAVFGHSNKILEAKDGQDAVNQFAKAVEGSSVDINATLKSALELRSTVDQTQAARVADAQAQLEQAQVNHALNVGTVVQDAAGDYHVNVGESSAPLKVWDEVTKSDSGSAITPEQAAAQREHYKNLGFDVIHYEDSKLLPDGAYDPASPNTLFLSNDPSRNASQVAAHEVTHGMEKDQLPNGTTAGELLRETIAKGITTEGWQHAIEQFSASMPEMPKEGATVEEQMTWAAQWERHMLRELGADMGGEAPKFEHFMPRVVAMIETQHGEAVAKSFLKQFVDSIKAAADAVRKFFGKEPTVSQTWVKNLDEVHGVLAGMYARQYGTQLQAEHAKIAEVSLEQRRVREREFARAKAQVTTHTEDERTILQRDTHIQEGAIEAAKTEMQAEREVKAAELREPGTGPTAMQLALEKARLEAGRVRTVSAASTPAPGTAVAVREPKSMRRERTRASEELGRVTGLTIDELNKSLDKLRTDETARLLQRGVEKTVATQKVGENLKLLAQAQKRRERLDTIKEKRTSGKLVSAEDMIVERAGPIAAPADASPELRQAFDTVAKAPFNRTAEEKLNLQEVEAGTRQSPKSDIGHRRIASGESAGRYVGAPDWVGNSPQALGALRTKLGQLAKEGEVGRYWYEKSARAVLQFVGGDKEQAEKFIGLLAIFSANTQLTGNTTFALQAWYQWKSGVPVRSGHFPTRMSRVAQAWLDEGKDYGGIKVNNFYTDLMEEIDPSKVDHTHATMDMWMAIAFDYGFKTLDQGPKYGFALREIAALAKQIGWRPHQVQAAIWTAMRARVTENADAYKEREVRLGIRQRKPDGGYDKFDPKKAYEHFRNVHYVAMRSPITQEQIDAHNVDYATELKARTAQMSWEAEPGSSTGLLPGLLTAPLKQKQEYLQAIIRTLTGADGSDLIADLAGIAPGRNLAGLSAYEGIVGAGMQTFLPIHTEGSKGSKAVAPIPRSALNLFAAIKGYVLSQNSVAWHLPIYEDSKIRHNGFEIRSARALTERDMKTLYQAVFDEFGTWEIAPAYTDAGARLLNFVEGLDNAQYQAGMRRVMLALPNSFGGGRAQHAGFRSDGELISNNWQEHPSGEKYRDYFGTGRPDLQERAADLRARVASVNRDFARRYGWDAQPAGAAGTRSDGRSDGEGTQQSPKRPGSVDLVGVHYGQTPRTSYDGRFYGGGMKGQEAARVLASPDTRLHARIYAYLNTGSGVYPEKYVGGLAHRVQMRNLYDLNSDSLNLLRLGDSGMESAVLDAGFDGYFTRLDNQGVAVVMGEASHAVPAEAQSASYRGNDLATPPAPTYSAAEQLARGVMADRSLPHGSMTGAEWRAQLERSQKLNDAALLEKIDDSKTYYRDGIAQLAREVQPLTESAFSPKTFQNLYRDKLGQYQRANEMQRRNLSQEVLPVVLTPAALQEMQRKDGSKPLKRSPFLVGTFATIVLKGRNEHERSQHQAAIPDSILERLPELLADPLEVFERRSKAAAGDYNGGVLVFTKAKVGNDYVAVAINPEGVVSGQKVNMILSVHPRTEGQRELYRAEGGKLTASGYNTAPASPASIAGAEAAGQTVYSSKIVGASRRQYTTAHDRFFGNVGRKVDEPSIKQRVADLRKDLGLKLAQGLVDQFAPLKNLDPKAYTLARLAKGAAGALEALLHHGKLSIRDGAYDADMSGGFIKRLGTAMHGELEDFLWWVSAHRADRLMQEDREHLFSAQDIADGKTLSDGQLGFDYKIQNGPRTGQTTRSRSEMFKDALVTFDGFNKNVMDMAEQSGLVDKDTRQFWEHEFYVPFYRTFGDAERFIGARMKNGLVRQKAFEKLEGGREKLNSDILTNVLSNWAHLVDAAGKNRAAKVTLEAASKVALDAQGNPTGATPVAMEAPEATARELARAMGLRDNVVSFMDQGRERYFIVQDPHLLAAITSLEFAGLRGPIMDAMSTFKHWLTIGVTASPAFKVRNLIRDSVQAIATGELSYNPVTNIISGLKASDPDSQSYVSALASGGLIRFGTMLENRASDRVRQLVRGGIKESTILDSEHKFQAFYDQYIAKAVGAYNELGNRSEEINRSALYTQLIAKGMDHAEASLMARDLMDFSLQGSWTSIRFLAQIVPFFNARLQGLYKLGRSGVENPQRMAYVLGAVTLASLALLAAYHDDDDWKKREEWDVENYWWFKMGGVAFRIPKPFEIGAIATLAERGAQYFTDPEMTGSRLTDRVLSVLGNQLAMNPIPQAVKPLLDIYSNKDSFTGRPIESMGMENLRPDYRFTGHTSMLARGVGTVGEATIGQLPGVDFLSPVQIDHLIRGYFSWLGTFVVGGADMAVRPLTGEPTQPSTDMIKFATQNFASELPADQSRYVSHMYDQAKQLEEAYGTFRGLLKQGKAQEAREFMADNQDKLAKYRSVEAVKRAEASINERIRLIERSTADPEAKRAEIRKLNEQKDRVARLIK